MGMFMAMGGSYLSVSYHLALRQLQTPGLATCVGPRLQWWRWGEWERDSSVCISKYECLWGKNPSETHRRVHNSCSGYGFVSSVVKTTWIVCTVGHWKCSHFCYMEDIGSSCFPSFFLLTIHLNVACLLGENEVGSSCSIQKGWGTWSLTLLSLTPWRELFLVGKFSFVVEPWWHGECDDRSKTKLLFLLLWSYSQFFPTVLLKFKWIPKLSQCSFVPG